MRVCADPSPHSLPVLSICDIGPRVSSSGCQLWPGSSHHSSVALSSASEPPACWQPWPRLWMVAIELAWLLVTASTLHFLSLPVGLVLGVISPASSAGQGWVPACLTGEHLQEIHTHTHTHTRVSSSPGSCCWASRKER